MQRDLLHCKECLGRFWCHCRQGTSSSSNREPGSACPFQSCSCGQGGVLCILLPHAAVAVAACTDLLRSSHYRCNRRVALTTTTWLLLLSPLPLLLQLPALLLLSDAHRDSQGSACDLCFGVSIVDCCFQDGHIQYFVMHKFPNKTRAKAIRPAPAVRHVTFQMLTTCYFMCYHVS